MNPLRDMLPDIPPCPHCGHSGEGLQWALPDAGFVHGLGFTRAQCACLACGKHGAARPTYDSAIEAFAAGKIEEAA
jgi:hypothetical protein